MKLHEYQAKELLKNYGAPIPGNAGVAITPEETYAAVERFGGRAVLKAQVHSGGRGKAGGIKAVDSPTEGADFAVRLLGSLLKTHQVPDGVLVKALLIEEPVDIVREYYVGIVPDRGSQRNVIMISARGGMDIEDVAREEPDAITRVFVDPELGMTDFEVREAIYDAGIHHSDANQALSVVRQLYSAYTHSDSLLAEINPLAVAADGRLVVADAKFEVDDSALFRHADFARFGEDGGEHPLESKARAADIAYVRLGGDIGIICNGAGLTMTTMDEVKRAGGKPADFLDVGGGAQADRVQACLELVLDDANVKAVLINIFGGITRCDDVAHGIIAATNAMRIEAPIVVRLAGTRSEEGIAILAGSKLSAESTMQAAASRVVALAAQR